MRRAQLLHPINETTVPSTFAPLLANVIRLRGKSERKGVGSLSAERRSKMLLGPKGRSIPIGPDAVFWDPKFGKVQVLEAKGGSSSLKWTYNSLQGTNTNTIRSADGFVRNPGTNRREKVQAARIIKAAQKGHLTTGVVRTKHVFGSPRRAQQVGSLNTDNVAKEARQLERELVRRHPELRKVFRRANFLNNVDRLTYHGAMRTSQLGSSIARLSSSSATRLAGLKRIGHTTGPWFVPLAVSISGVTIVWAHYQYSSGLWSRREFDRSSAGFTISVLFTATGAIVGGTLLGVGVVPGASLGALAAVPAQIAAEFVVELYYRNFDLQQRRFVDAAVEKFYGVDATFLGES